jgi:hypothetical protein
LLVETLEIAKIMSVVRLALAALDQLGDFCGFLAQPA